MLDLVHLVATLAMATIAWYVQIVHYPLMARVGAAEFPRFEREHQRRTTWIVAPLMLAEAATAALLLAWQPSATTGLGAGLVVVVWLSTFLWQVPLHQRLERGFDAAVHARLVASNWLRTAIWSVRGVVAVGLAVGRGGG